MFGQLPEVRYQGKPAGEFAFVTPRMTEKEFRAAESSLHSMKQCIRLLTD